MAQGTLKIKRVTQDPTDPTGQSFVVHCSDLTYYERGTVPVQLSQKFSPTDYSGPETVVIRHAHREFFTQQKLREKLKALVAEAEP